MIRLAALAGLLLLTGTPSAQVASGGPLPEADRTLSALDGSTLRLDAATGPEGLVVVFWSTACPWTDRYAPRLSELIASYAPAGVGFALIAEPGPAAAAGGAVEPPRRPAAAGLAAPYVTDADGSLAEAFGAGAAPHAFFFGPDRALVYDGAIDDSPANAERVQVPYLQQAMDQSIAGIPVEVVRTQAFGCTISGQR